MPIQCLWCSEASSLADRYFAKGNGGRAHTLATIGNCHIDSAWLWPYSETKRKVARSFSSQLKLMEDYPEFIFVASQVGRAQVPGLESCPVLQGRALNTKVQYKDF